MTLQAHAIQSRRNGQKLQQKTKTKAVLKQRPGGPDEDLDIEVLGFNPTSAAVSEAAGQAMDAIDVVLSDN